MPTRSCPQTCLVAGVGFHNAAMEGDQRELVEGLFLAGDLPVSAGGARSY